MSDTWQIVYRGVDVTPMAIHKWATSRNTLSVPQSMSKRDLVLAGARPLNNDECVYIRSCRTVKHEESATCTALDEIWYGAQGYFVNVTHLACQLWNRNDGVVTIPTTDVERAKAVGDPCVGIVKSILIATKDAGSVFPANRAFVVSLPLLNHQDMTDNLLGYIHNHSTLQNGTFAEEYPEQTMAASFVRRDAKVLELGSNIGRNTIVIAKLLDSSANLVTLETDPVSASILNTNRLQNALDFSICNAALSKRKLAQRDWDCVPYGDNEPIPAGHMPVDTISWDALRKHCCADGRQFDTLVADCEGALYWILLDEPDFMLGFETVIVENDYRNIDHYNYVQGVMKKAGLERVFVKSGGFGPCIEFFYEVWRSAIITPQ